MTRLSRPFFALLLLLALPAQAAEGIAMHGAPKYGQGFRNFAYVNPEAPKGGMLHLGVVGTFDSLHPFIVRGTVPQAPAFSLFSSAAVYETLMARAWDEPFSLYGLLAQDVETPQDRSSVTFTLRPEARWNDGLPVTVEDVLFSFETLREKGRPNHRTYYKKVEKAEALDTRRVRFSFKKNPDGTWDREMPLIMGLMPLLPQHDWAGRDFNQTTLRPPVASGPYRVTAVEPGRSLTLTRNPDYWGKKVPAVRGMYNFDEVKIDFYRDENIALQAFKAGAYDLRREPDPRKWVENYAGPALDDGRMLLKRFAHHRPEAITGFIFNTRRAPLNDLALRKAAALAFDFGWINKTIFHGLYKRSESYFPNSELAGGFHLPETDGSEAARRKNLLEAAAILEKAGYRLKDGALVSPQGTAVAFEVMLADPTEEKIALEWARNLQRLGIKARVRTVDSAQYQARLTAFDYDVTTGRWFNSLSPGNEQVFFWGCAAAGQQGSRNYAGICDPEIDRLASAIPAAKTREELVEETRSLDRRLMEGFYIVPFYYLGADQIAYWPKKIVPPSVTPLYGPILESWWRAAEGG